MKTIYHHWVSLLTLTLISVIAFAANQDPWLAHGLKDQRTLTLWEPLARFKSPGTHNSYNSSAYRAGSPFHIGDPNQTLSITDQLNAGARLLELDVHWYSPSGKLKLCHRFCLPKNQFLRQGAREINQWLQRPENRYELIVLFVQDYGAGHYDQIYRDFGQLTERILPAASEGAPFPNQMTPINILSQGKQVILTGLNKAPSGHPLKQLNHGFIKSNNSVFDGLFTGYPTCDFNGRSAADMDLKLTRLYEDQTFLSDLVGEKRKLSAEQAKEMTDCGLGLFGYDKLTLNDNRLYSNVWSWAEDFPDHANGHCATLRSDGRWKNSDCASQHPFACQNKSTGDWTITSDAGSFNDGQAACQKEFDADVLFTVPKSGYHNRQLQERAEGMEVWINFSDQNHNRQWLPDDRVLPELPGLAVAAQLTTPQYRPLDMLIATQCHSGKVILLELIANCIQPTVNWPMKTIRDYFPDSITRPALP